MKYSKVVTIDAFTFDEFIQYGIDAGANVINGIPYSFQFYGHAVTHETNEHYIVSGMFAQFNFTPNDMIVIDDIDRVMIYPKEFFYQVYTKAE